MTRYPLQGFITGTAWSALHTDEVNYPIQYATVFFRFVSVTVEHDACRNSQNLNVVCKFNFVLKHLLPLSPCITVKWLTVLLQGQVLSAIWITVSPRLWWHHHAQLPQIWLKANASRAHKLDLTHNTNDFTTNVAVTIIACPYTDYKGQYRLHHAWGELFVCETFHNISPEASN